MTALTHGEPGGVAMWPASQVGREEYLLAMRRYLPCNYLGATL